MVVGSILYFVSKLIFWRADGFGMFLTERMLLAAGAVGGLLLAITKSMWISVLAVLSICAILTDAVSVGVELILGKAGDVSLLAAFGLGAVFCLIGLWCFLRAV